MRYEDIYNSVTAEGNIEGRRLPELLNAISQVYPVILLANLSKNNYVMIQDVNFLEMSAPINGNYDEMIKGARPLFYEEYQGVFEELFDREKLLARYENGITTNSAKCYVRVKDGSYKWVNLKAVRINDESGDVVQLCLDEILPE